MSGPQKSQTELLEQQLKILHSLTNNLHKQQQMALAPWQLVLGSLLTGAGVTACIAVVLWGLAG